MTEETTSTTGSVLGNEPPKAEGASTGGAAESQYNMDDVPEWVRNLELDDAIKADPSLKPIQDINNLAKSYVNAQKMIGADKIVIPGKHATEDDWKEVFRKLGNPESLDDYDPGVETKLDTEFDKEFFDAFRAKAHASGVLPQQAKQLYDWFDGHMTNILEQQNKQSDEFVEQGLSELKKEWGDSWDKNVSLAQHAVQELGGNNLREYLVETGLANDPMLIQVFSKVGQMYGEDKFIGEGNLGIGKTADEVQNDLDSYIKDYNGPYYNKAHPNHAQAVKTVQSLMEKLN